MDGHLVHKGDGHVWTVKDELNQYRKDIEEDEKLAERLEAEDEDLVALSFEKSTELETLREEHRTMSGDVMRLMRLCDAERTKRDRLTATIDQLREEIDATRGLAVIEKERYHRKIEEVKRTESELKEAFATAQASYEEQEKALKDDVGELETKLQDAREMSVEIQRLRDDAEIRQHEIRRMKRSLEFVKEDTLHEAVDEAAVQSEAQSKKLHNVIAHLQKELNVSRRAAEALEAEQNILNEEVNKARRRNQELLTALRLRERTRGGENAEGTDDDDDETVKALRRRLEELTASVDLERRRAEELETQIRERSDANDSTSDRLENDIDALRAYVSELQSRVQQKKARNERPSSRSS